MNKYLIWIKRMKTFSYFFIIPCLLGLDLIYCETTFCSKYTFERTYFSESSFPVIETSASTKTKKDTLPIYCVNTTEKKIALTFDAAWGDEDLEKILTILKYHHAPSCFFVTGDWVSRYPEAIKKIVSYGHELGSHGDNHKHMSQLSPLENQTELSGCFDKVKSLTGLSMNLFRAPYGDYNEALIQTAKEQGYYTIQWNVDSLDWKDYGVSSIINTVINHKNLKPGSIILLHNGSTYTKDALDSLLTQLEEKGYTFCLISDLIYKENYTIDQAGEQHPLATPSTSSTTQKKD